MFSSAAYWETRYKNGRSSGWGSYGKLAAFKAETVNNLIETYNIYSMIDFGCGDGNQLQFFKVPKYLGVDVSETAIKKCTELYKNDPTKTFKQVKHPEYLKGYTAELILSLDVLFHLVEDDIYSAYMDSLFTAAQRFVVVYSSNFDKKTAAHERERKFTDYVTNKFTKWALTEKINNPWPISKHTDGSLSDFYIYQRKL